MQRLRLPLMHLQQLVVQLGTLLSQSDIGDAPIMRGAFLGKITVFGRLLDILRHVRAEIAPAEA
jgi:hypothetical protein